MTNELARSIEICECLDGPYEGHIVRVGSRAAFIEVRDLCDATKPLERYQVVVVDGHKELKWAPTDGRLLTVTIHCTKCGNRRIQDLATKRVVEMTVRVTAAHVDELRADLRKSRCQRCDGMMDLEIRYDLPSM